MDSLLKQQWYPICQSQDVLSNKPIRRLLFNLPIVLYKVDSKLYAFIDKCPHRGAPLSSGIIKDKQLQCPYHGWQFNNQGQCQHVPGLCSNLNSKQKELMPVKIQQHLGLVFACLNQTEESQNIYSSPNQQRSGYDYFIWQTEMEGQLLNILENFLDGCHTHFVHKGWLRTEGFRNITETEVTITENTAQALYHDGKTQSGIISKLFEPSRSHSIGRYSYPMTAEIEYHTVKDLHFAITVFLSPISKNSFQAFSLLTYKKNYVPGLLKKWLFMPFIKTALRQDKRILALQQQNLSHFEETNFRSTEIDVLGVHIERILNRQSRNYSKNVKINL